jgi:two-component system, OmpR family, alkaline phosphatase synthesis response regulator PhoP
MKKIVLIADDEKDIADLVAYNLEREGFAVLKAQDGHAAWSIAGSAAMRPDLVILDLMMPGIQGMEVCRMIRKNPATANMPVIILTAKSDQIDKILGLEMGADDYVTKPFHVRELIARVRAVLRRAEARSETHEAGTFIFEGLHVDYGTYEVTVEGKKVALGPMETKLLHFLSRHPGRVYSRDQLLDYVWGDESFVEPRTVDVHISRLRAAIEKDKESPHYILTVRGIGYKFADVR